MDMFRAALTVGVIFIGAIAALLGLVVLVYALSTGAVTVSFGPGMTETITQAADPNRFMKIVLGLGLAPFLIGATAAYLAMRRLRG